MSNPETRLVWHPLQARLKDLRTLCLLDGKTPPHWRRTEVRDGEGGFPDLWWGWGTSGLVELKYRAAPPAGPEAPCSIESITPQQRLFWRMAGESDASVHVLTRVGLEWFLHCGLWAREHLGRVPTSVMRLNNKLGDGDQEIGLEVRALPPAGELLRLCGANP